MLKFERWISSVAVTLHRLFKRARGVPSILQLLAVHLQFLYWESTQHQRIYLETVYRRVWYIRLAILTSVEEVSIIICTHAFTILDETFKPRTGKIGVQKFFKLAGRFSRRGWVVKPKLDQLHTHSQSPRSLCDQAWQKNAFAFPMLWTSPKPYTRLRHFTNGRKFPKGS